MAKNILIPIDFCVASLNTLRLVLEENKTEEIHATLVFAEYLNDSELDLLFYSSERIIAKHMTNEFKEALEVLKNRYTTLKEVDIKHLHGNNKAYAKNFLSANKINEIHLPKTYKLKITNQGFNPEAMLRKTYIPVFEKEWEQYLNKSEQEHLIALFN